MEYPLYIVDAFTRDDLPFTGNAAAVCILKFDDDISDEIKQKIASQMNISETAFVAKGWNKDSAQEPNKYTLRWFTPTLEVELCGHATLASSRVIFDTYSENKSEIQFETKFKGILRAINNSLENTITLDFPLNKCQTIDRKTNKWIEDIVKYSLGSQLSGDLIQEIEYSAVTKKLLLRLKDRPESEHIIYKVNPDFNKLLTIDTNDLVRGVIVTQKSQTIHFISRYFAPWNGINEDPVTGAAHTVLASYWKRQYDESGAQFDKLIAKQCSKRGGIVICRVVGDRVELSGKTRAFLSGNIII